MSNESPERRDREIADSTFDGWVAQKAAERETSRERVLEQLLDSYWTLEQISQVMGGRGDSSSLGDRSASTDRDDDRETNGTVTEYTELLDSVESLQTELETASRRHAALAEEVRSLSERLDDVEATQDAVDGLAERVETVASSLEADQERLHARMDDEFDDLQTILEYLVETSERLDARVDETQQEYRAEIRELRTERDQLRRLREEAHDHGTHRADCEQCGATVDLTLLTTPECPNCMRHLTGVTAETNWWVLTSYTATTETRATESRAPESDDDSPDGGRTRSGTSGSADQPADDDESPAVTRGGDERGPPESETGTPPDESGFQWVR